MTKKINNKPKSAKEVQVKSKAQKPSSAKSSSVKPSSPQAMKKESNKDKKNEQKGYFGVIFISLSVIAILFFFILLVWFKNSLFLAKDLIEVEALNSDQQNIGLETDPFLTPGDIYLSPDKEPTIQSGPVLGGDSGKKVKLFYFSDFDCPFCLEQERVIKNIFEKYKNDIVVVWKDFPEADFDSFSYQAARAARCAHEQGAFWGYSDLLREEKSQVKKIDTNSFLLLADKIKLDLDAFWGCLNSTDVDMAIIDDIIEGENLGISGIPYFHIGGQDYVGSIDEEELVAIIDREIEK